MPHLRRFGIALLLAGTIVGCLDEGRLNATCEWRGDSAFALGVWNREHLEHLTRDAQLAEANGIRYGDSFRETRGIPESIRLREECTARLFGVVSRNHGVDTTMIRRAALRRNLLFDVSTMWLPAFVGLLFFGRVVARRICRSWDHEEDLPRALSLVALTPVVAGFFVGMAQMWSWLVETMRFRDSHMSYRVGRLLTSSHGWWFFAAAAIVFVVIAATEYRRTPSRVHSGHESPSLPHRRHANLPDRGHRGRGNPRPAAAGTRWAPGDGVRAERREGEGGDVAPGDGG